MTAHDSIMAAVGRLLGRWRGGQGENVKKEIV